MSGRPAPDAELDEALALVNDDHDRRTGRRTAGAPGGGDLRGASVTSTASADSDAPRPDAPPQPPSGPAAPDTPPVTAAPATGHTGASGSRAPASTSQTKHRDTTTPWPAARTVAGRAPGNSLSARSAVPLGQALGLVLAAPLVALTDLPSFDTSAMDGWVVAGPGPWDVRADGILAGHGQPGPLSDGEAVRIATGARIPQEATAVIRSEHGLVDDKGRLHPRHDVTQGQDIRPRGQECRSGDQLLPRGTLVTPVVLGLAAAAGYDELSVVPRPTAEVLILGDELLTEGLPHEGLIRDALGPMLPPWLRSLGAEVIAVRRLGDDAEVLHQAITTSSADLIVTTGGTASGPVDHVHPILRRIGAELLVDGVAVRPGHPMLLARIRPDQHLVGLPGNPLAAVSGLLTLAEPLLRTLSGRPAPSPYAAVLREDVHGHPHDTRLVPVTLRADHAVPLHYNGPAMLRGIAVADGLAVVPPGGGRRGQELEVLDLPWAGPDLLTDSAGECFT
ncbi:molybdopterin molybdenumtransferase MoeA [Streptomyces longisporoflavus]|uniref:molybdopterin molybdotransferase MoeA n=1 Tax=Streptomyces longisporoflavus TaxID=28044 RepID=UPI00167E9559|nr:molybdopterin molybdotransferase MoeA [Streptomyces longisporoflavus]GGV50129.1 molybdopterin molybdenumtransferase MoeA [Streptomyces longisporoflavus]